MNEVSEVRADLDAVGRGTVEVGGVDHSDALVGVEIVAGFGQPTRVLLHERAGVSLVVEGAVTIVRAQTGIVEFLNAVDPDTLEHVALTDHGHLPTGASFLAALVDMAREAADDARG